ncbi:hypothetical protein PR003_g7242 [Phytophthora rubi]|uniref:BZIP domain-containing protein n=1 Tax=Phytophthora rubi TaxID=129364 RepID=A0A6A3N236_9STRA|nr:hypothetical protein PR002_g6157 [Phytophthora rubi]KAE9048167.1 hypothetical protein PR001_g3926 [Phytophthora rubi]KAE9346830.1 hypothetical protein PR003_g7242 [Phytophthora rubi]
MTDCIALSATDLLNLLSDDSPTETSDVALDAARALEDPKARKRAKHRAVMVEFRLNKKEKKKKLEAEHQRLEREMKTLVDSARTAAGLEDGGVSAALRELVVEREALQTQNVALREEIKRHEKLQALVHETSEDPTGVEESTLLSHGESGWRVNFEGGGPSFYFHPLTRDEFDTTMQRFDAELKSGKSSLSMVRTFFGWEVRKSPLVTASDGKSLLVRTRVSKRLRCSLDVHQKLSYTKQKDLSPIIVTPVGWGLHKRTNVSTQVLQEFDQDAVVLAHNIPGPEKDLRYLFQVRRSQWQLQDGRRKLTASLVITDSDANRRSRDAEGFQDGVEWATEGGIYVAITEVDENYIDVVCDHWAACQSELHAEYLMIQWTQFSVWWEQLTVPSNLLLS